MFLDPLLEGQKWAVIKQNRPWQAFCWNKMNALTKRVFNSLSISLGPRRISLFEREFARSFFIFLRVTGRIAIAPEPKSS